MVLFSVVIPVFNRANLIKATIDSVLNQRLNNYEIIIVDDGSTDNTLEVLEQYSDQIKVFQQKNQGPGKARNLGIQNTQGKYIVFLDSDDIWFPWTLEVFAAVIKERNQPAFLAGKAVFFKDEHELNEVEYSQLRYTTYQDLYSSSENINLFFVGSVVIRSDILEEVGCFTDRWINSEDNDLWMRLGTARGFFYIHSPFLLGYRQHSNSSISITSKTYEGTCYLIEQEKTSQYPGGKTRKRERLEILTRHIRPVSLELLRQSEIRKGWYLYKETLQWHFLLGRFSYLIGFLWLMFLANMSSKRK